MNMNQEQREGLETSEGVTQDTQEKIRVRKAKKPEIQIYRPGALRSRRSNSSSDLPPQNHETQAVKSDTVVEVNEDKQTNEVQMKTYVKGKRDRKSAKEDVGENRGDTGDKKKNAKENNKKSPKKNNSNLDMIHSPVKTEERLPTNKSPKDPYRKLDSKVVKDVLPIKENHLSQLTRHSEMIDVRVDSAKENRESNVGKRITSLLPDDRGSGRKNTYTSNQKQQEQSENISGVKSKPSTASRLFGNHLGMQSEWNNAPEIRPVRREEKKRGKSEKQSGKDRYYDDRPSSHYENRNLRVQNERAENIQSKREFHAWIPEVTLTPDKCNVKGEKSHHGKSPVKSETPPQSEPPRGKEVGKTAGEEVKAGGHRYNNKDRHERTKSDKEIYEHYSRNANLKGNKMPHKTIDKTDSKVLPDIESLKVNDNESKCVQELAAKVDQLVCSKNMGKSPNSKKKSRGWCDYQIETKEYVNADFKKGTYLEDNPPLCKSESPEKRKTDNRGDDKVSPVSKTVKGNNEKTPRAKSYSSARENRRKKGNNKGHSPGNLSSSQKEEVKTEVTLNRDSSERVALIPHKNELNASEQIKSYHGRGSTETSSNKKIEAPYPQKGIVSTKNKPSRYKRAAGETCSPGKYDSEDDGVENIMLHDDDEDWIKEVDSDMTWCNQNEGKARLYSWEDEKQSWRTRRVKHHSEDEDPVPSIDSPGRKGGLIQLQPTITSTESAVTEPLAPYQSPTPPLVIQKHLYNPNNPNKPVAVVPSARDLPVSRDTTRAGIWGSPGEGVGGLSSQQGGQLSEYTMEGSSTKVDPSLLYSISKGEMDINYYVSSNQLPVEFRRIMDIRGHLQGCYRQLLLSDIRLCQEKNIESSLWKTLYYVIIEKLREYISRDPTLKERSLATLLMLVEEGLHYLQDLLEALQREYGFTLEDYLEEEGEVRGRVRMALLSAQKLLLSLGDLARYKEQYNASPNYIAAKKWYQMALQVYPRNGRPFNQLAIIAFSQKRPLDVVYYYIRSLTASNPIMSARDALVSMFDDFRKRYASVQQSEPRLDGSSSIGRSLSHEGLRQELWIRPDSGVTNRRTLSHSSNDENSDKDEDLKNMPVEQLMKQFLASYLHCHGMLFSGVGLDEFHECCVNMLQEFSVLLRVAPPRLSTTHLLQIMAINMYAITNTELKDARVDGSGYRSAAQELALVLAQEMMGLLVRVVVEMMPQHVHHHPPPPTSASTPNTTSTPSPDTTTTTNQHRLFSPALAHFMPPLTAWCDWLLYHSPVWNPPPPVARDYSVDGEDTWASVAELATMLRGFRSPDVTLEQNPASIGSSGDLVPLRLMEDNFLRGYEPLLSAHSSLTYTPSTALMGRARDWARVARLQTCLCQFLCGVDPPVLRLQKTDGGDVLVSVVDNSPPPSPAAAKGSFSGSDVELDESWSESETSEGGEEEQELEGGVEEDGLSSTVKLLKERKKMLEKRHRQQKRLHSLLEAPVTLEMEIRPRYLVPDTNCFIEHLDVVQDLAGGPYTVMVPLVVLNELDGLSRDAVVAKYRSVGHAVRVREGAATALHYLRSSRPHSIKCVTSQGSVLSSTLFTSEMDLPDITNDDKILSCCVHFCSDSTQRRPIRAGVRRLYREVVLLTEDRNLRVKAHARDVPVRDLLDFARWAGVR